MSPHENCEAGSVRIEPSLRLAGHNRPVDDPNDDLLDHRAIAGTILRAIANAPLTWSTRIGLHGPWGSGKTGVLNLLEAQVNRRYNDWIVVRFAAWQAAGESDLLEAFCNALVEKIQARTRDPTPFNSPIRLPTLDRAKQVLRKCGPGVRKLASVARSASQAAENLPDGAAQTAIAVGGAAVALTVDTVSAWMSRNGADLKRLQEALQGRTVLVCIDDLDRADPKALPKAMLALRELLDWPGLTFVLAFDKAIVAKSLSEYSKAYGESAERFLEKIIDLGFDLPNPTEAQRTRLARQALDTCCPFMEEAQRAALAPWLPENPRQSKLVARKLGVLNDVAQRHDRGELDWLAIGLQYVLREEDEPLAREIESRFLGRSAEFADAVGQPTTVRNGGTAFDHVVNRTVPKASPERARHLVALAHQVAQARQSATKQQIVYEMTLLFEEPAVTAKEFRALADRLVGSSVHRHEVEAEIHAAIDRIGCTIDHAALQLFRLALDACRRAASLAANEPTTAIRQEHRARARRCFDLLDAWYQQTMPEAICRLRSSRMWVIEMIEGLLEIAMVAAEPPDTWLAPLRSLAMSAAKGCSEKVELHHGLTKPLARQRVFDDHHRRGHDIAGIQLVKNLRKDAADAISEDVVSEALRQFDDPGWQGRVRRAPPDGGDALAWLFSEMASSEYAVQQFPHLRSFFDAVRDVIDAEEWSPVSQRDRRSFYDQLRACAMTDFEARPVPSDLSPLGPAGEPAPSGM